MENQMVEVSKHRLEALADCIESCVALWRENTDLAPGQHPDEILLGLATSVKGWIKNGCGNGSKSKE